MSTLFKFPSFVFSYLTMKVGHRKEYRVVEMFCSIKFQTFLYKTTATTG